MTESFPTEKVVARLIAEHMQKNELQWQLGKLESSGEILCLVLLAQNVFDDVKNQIFEIRLHKPTHAHEIARIYVCYPACVYPCSQDKDASCIVNHSSKILMRADSEFDDRAIGYVLRTSDECVVWTNDKLGLFNNSTSSWCNYEQKIPKEDVFDMLSEVWIEYGKTFAWW